MRALLALALVLPLAAQAQPQGGQWLPRGTAELQLLDKVTARVSTLRAAVNTPAQFGPLTILVRACNARPADEVPDALAWMEVSDSRLPPGQQQVFRGWMFANAPAANMLEHPIYDLRVLECR